MGTPNGDKLRNVLPLAFEKDCSLRACAREWNLLEGQLCRFYHCHVLGPRSLFIVWKAFF